MKRNFLILLAGGFLFLGTIVSLTILQAEVVDSNPINQKPIQPKNDLRDMLRQHIISRSIDCMERASKRRKKAIQSGNIEDYRSEIKQSVQNFYRELPVGKNSKVISATHVSTHEKKGYRIENVLFESFPGWQVNATVYVPTEFEPPYPPVVVPVGHSGKQFKNYQLPCQFFARCGYLAIVFDPPGCRGEKQEGNDHFIDGVRAYLVGKSSSRYFVADAMRCIDYLQTRSDVDMSNGVAMTGVSGGGVTTTLCAVLDDRITVTGPSCCVTPLVNLDITQCYAGCPEAHMWRRYAEGIDQIDLICSITPKPTLLMAGRFDEVFRIDDTKKLADETEAFYDKAGAKKNFQFFIDDSGHGYTLRQAREFVKFMNKHLLGKPERKIPELKDSEFALDPYDHIRCHPSNDVHMRSLTLKEAQKLEKKRECNPSQIHQKVIELANIKPDCKLPKAKTSKPFRIWTHYWQQILLEHENDIELPGTLLLADKNSKTGILHFDNVHRNNLLHKGGLLAQAIRFLNRDKEGINILSVDLRGWGDTKPTMYPYETASWGGVDRYLSYATAALGDPVMSMRIRDGLAALKYFKNLSEVDPNQIIITGGGEAGIVALHVAAIDKDVKGVIVWDTLFSFKSLLEEKAYTWPHDIFFPNILLYYDLPELVKSLPCDVFILNPLDGVGKGIPQDALNEHNKNIGKEVYSPTFGLGLLMKSIEKLQ